MLTINKLMWEQHLGHSNPADISGAGIYTYSAATECKPRGVMGLELPSSSCPDCSIEGTILQLPWSENNSSKTKMLMQISSGGSGFSTLLKGVLLLELASLSLAMVHFQWGLLNCSL